MINKNNNYLSKILITGAATGIGRDSALELAQRDHAVIATAKKIKDLDNFKSKVQKQNLKLQFDEIDVRKESDLQKIAHYQPDILISNAAIGESGPVSEIPMERVRNNIETNLMGVIRGCQIAAKYMLKNGTGRLIILGSVAGNMVVPFNGAYHMTKHALEALADGLRQELEPKGIFASIIEPGKIDTGFNQRMAATKYEWLDKNSAFADKIKSLKKSDKFWEGGATTKPVVKSIVKAVESKIPRTRYFTPLRYHFLMPIIWLAPDRLFDKAIRRILGV